MEALSFVRRRGGQETNYAEEWRGDLGDATVRTLLSQGVNLIIMTLHKGAGLKSEAQDIAAAREFVGVARQRGLKVGGYVGGTLFYETLEAEEPASKDWKQVDEFGHPIYYVDPSQTFRYMACRNNPGYLAYIKRVVKVGVEDLRMDMIHFDQMMWVSAPASCHCNHCRKQFREFLKVDTHPSSRYNDLALRMWSSWIFHLSGVNHSGLRKSPIRSCRNGLGSGPGALRSAIKNLPTTSTSLIRRRLFRETQR
jgi:hypothetical protein